jgi:hypothetical protein
MSDAIQQFAQMVREALTSEPQSEQPKRENTMMVWCEACRAMTNHRHTHFGWRCEFWDSHHARSE